LRDSQYSKLTSSARSAQAVPLDVASSTRLPPASTVLPSVVVQAAPFHAPTLVSVYVLPS
jgi:hypothetical protein